VTTSPTKPPRVSVIAEIGSVHNGDFDAALKLATLAKECGADVVKYQTHVAEAETTKDAPSPSYFNAEKRFDYFKRTAFTPEQWKILKKHCDKIGIEFLSSPFSEEAVDILKKTGMNRWKIPSGEVTNLPMLEKIAKLKQPVILSSGMSSWKELDAAVKTIKKHHSKLTILQCTSEYPCPPSNAGLNVMLDMNKRYKLPVGFSDHTMSIAVPIAAVALGASVVEKHLAPSRNMYGSDAKHSLEPDEFRMMVQGIRDAEAAVTTKVDKANVKKFTTMKNTFEKSVVSLVAIKKGTVITMKMLGIKKPGTGIPAAQIKNVIGCTAKKNIAADVVIKSEDII
jgi:N-acetylneuraminate synthase